MFQVKFNSQRGDIKYLSVLLLMLKEKLNSYRGDIMLNIYVNMYVMDGTSPGPKHA